MNPVREFSNKFHIVDIESIEAEISADYGNWNVPDNETETYILVHKLIPDNCIECISERFIQHVKECVIDFCEQPDNDDPRELLLMYGYLYNMYYGKHKAMPQFSIIVLYLIRELYSDNIILYYECVHMYAKYAINTIMECYNDLILTFPNSLCNIHTQMLYELPVVSLWDLYIVSCITDNSDFGCLDMDISDLNLTEAQADFEHETRNSENIVRYWNKEIRIYKRDITRIMQQYSYSSDDSFFDCIV